jgi:hypothetical protein
MADVDAVTTAAAEDELMDSGDCEVVREIPYLVRALTNPGTTPVCPIQRDRPRLRREYP